MTKWNELYNRFHKLSAITGISKFSSYTLRIEFSPNHSGEFEITVELGGYDIADWPRHLLIGPFKTEEEALQATKAKIIEAEEIVKREQTEDTADVTQW